MKTIWEFAPVTVKVHENGEPEILTGNWWAVPFGGYGMTQEIVCRHSIGNPSLVASVVFLTTRLEPGSKVIAYVLVALSEDGPDGPFEEVLDHEQDGDEENAWLTRTYNRLIQKALERIKISE